VGTIFNITATALEYLARLFNLTYNQVNIIVYYLLIPMSWLILIGIIINSHIGLVMYSTFLLGVFVGCGNFKKYCDKLFDSSARFLNSFGKVGSNYVNSSVIICVVLPVLIYITLIFLVINH
jgi:hypothetical protein